MMVLDVENDNKPSPDNIPQVPGSNRTVKQDYTHDGLEWGWSGIDHRKTLTIQDQKPS